MDGKKPICHIIRGLPGAGKSTLAARLGCLVISPQDMFATRGGVYRYREGQDVEALAWATRTALLAMDARSIWPSPKCCPVGRTPPTGPDLRRHGYDVRVTDLPVTAEQSDRRNTHSVPRPVIEEMALAWEPWDAETGAAQ